MILDPICQPLDFVGLVAWSFGALHFLEALEVSFLAFKESEEDLVADLVEALVALSLIVGRVAVEIFSMRSNFRQLCTYN